jgi:AraC-like DNA-binding protein
VAVPTETATRRPDHHQVEFTATSPESVQAYLTAAYGAPVRFSSDHCSYRFRHVRRGPGPFHLDAFDHAGTAECHCRPVPALACVWMQGGVRTDLDRDDHLGPGDLAISGQPGEMVHVRYASAQYTTVLVPLQTAADATRNRPDDDALVPLRFTALRPACPADARRWRQTVDYVTRSLLEHPEVMTQPLLSGAATRLLAVTMLTTFPNTWITESAIEDRRDAHPGTLRRAIAFIEANPDLDIGTVDIARAAHVTTRAIQLAFRRHLDTTPLAYLRRVRLERAHDELKRATPDDGVTVTAVASRWGFASPSRFSAYYHQAYGVLPSRTLRG